MNDRSLVGIFGGKSNSKLSLVLDADNNPKNVDEIFEPVLFRSLLNREALKLIENEQDISEKSKILKLIDPKSKIIEVETHKTRISQTEESDEKPFVFVVFQTTGKTDDEHHWWSLEENGMNVVLQRSPDKIDVKNKLIGEDRNQVEPIAEGLKGKGSIKDLFITLWIHMVIEPKYQRNLSRCESFIPLIMKNLAEIYYTYDKCYFSYSTLSSEEINPEMAEIIHLLTNVSNWHPLLCLTYMGDTSQLDRVLRGSFHLRNNINGIYSKLTLINSAILFSKTDMVRYLLNKKKINVGKCDKAGRNALHMAALFTEDEEMVKLLFEHPKIGINDYDKSGMTPLHYAIIASNVTIANQLITHNADTTKLDPTDHSPIHLAAHYAKDTQITDLLLTKVKIDECDHSGITALHSAAIASNMTSARYLIEKGADINSVDKHGRTPIHAAAAFAKNMDFINLFLDNENANLKLRDQINLSVKDYAKKNRNGLAKEIVDRIRQIKMKKYISSLFESPEDFLWNEVFRWHEDLRSHENFGLTRFDRNLLQMADDFIDYTKIIDSLLKIKQVPIDSRDSYGRTALHSAVAAYNSLTIAAYLIKEGSDPTSRDYRGRTPLHLAAKKAKEKNIIDLLLSIDQVNIDECDDCGETALHAAIKASNMLTASQLIDKGAHVNIFDKKGLTPLHLAAHYAKETDIIDLILKVKETKEGDKGIDDYDETTGTTALHYAVMASNTTTASYLIELGANPAHRDQQGRNALHIAAQYAKNKDIVDLILKNEKVDVDKCDELGMTAFNAAIKASNVIAVSHFIDMKANPQNRKSYGRYPLHLAAQFVKDTKIIDLILEHEKIEINERDESAKTALEYAIKASNVLAADYLIKKGEKHANNNGISTLLNVAAQFAKKTEMIDLILRNGQVNLNNCAFGMTALHEAIANSNLKIACYLIQKGADLTIRDKIGRTPLHMAAQFTTSTTIIDLLLGKKDQVKIDDVDYEGKTALHVAVGESNVTIARHLIDQGADPSILDNKGFSPLHEAAFISTNTELIDFLLNATNDDSGDGMTPLHAAVMGQNVKMIKHLIDKRGYLDKIGKDGRTPFYFAIYYAKTIDIIKAFLNSTTGIEPGDLTKNNNFITEANKNTNGLGKEIISYIEERGKIAITAH